MNFRPSLRQIAENIRNIALISKLEFQNEIFLFRFWKFANAQADDVHATARNFQYTFAFKTRYCFYQSAKVAIKACTAS